MRLLALDQSMRVSGWSVFDNQDLIVYGKFDASKISSDYGPRLKHIQKQVIELIKKYNIDHVVFEEIQLQNTVGNNVSTFKALAYVQAIIIETLYDMNIPYDIIASSSWKSTLGIKGRARAEQKQNAQKWVIEKYSITPTQDECDSICIGTHYIIKNQGFDWAKQVH